MTIEFSNTKASVWNSIQTALSEAGFIVANVSALDKQKGSFKAVTTPTAVKQDLVISAYKPNGGLEARFQKHAGSEDGIWDFVRSHLKYLPVTKPKKDGLEYITERDPRIIYDRMVSWYVQYGFVVRTACFASTFIQSRISSRANAAFCRKGWNDFPRRTGC
jgi:hypothetical protein